MPKTKNQFDRLLAIHNKLATGQQYTFAELRDACTPPGGKPPSEKTLYNDLRELRDMHGAPIPEGDRSGRPYYYRPGTRFSLHGALNPDDAALANEVAALMRQVAHLPQFAGLEDVFLKFEQRAGTLGSSAKAVVQFEQNPNYTGLRWLKPLYDIIRAEQPVLIRYCDFTGQVFRFEVSPYLLKEYNNRWYVFGWVAGQSALYNLALDRIEALTPLPNLRRRPDQTDWNAEFADVIGATRSTEPVETLRLRVWLPRAHYVRTKPLHPSQQCVAQTDTYLDFTYQLRWNNELTAKLLELGPDAELLEPADKRAAFAEKVQALAGRYDEKKWK